MCLLSYYPPGSVPVEEHLRHGAELNPHGSGFAFGTDVTYRDLDGKKAVTDFLGMHSRLSPPVPALFHSRNATGDSPRSPGNIHPFRSGNLVVAHNGYLFPHEGERSDSRVFAEDILPLYDLDDLDQVRMLETLMGPNKAVILRPDRPGVILNAELGVTLPDGTWHSNADYTGVPHVVPGKCPVCGVAAEGLVCGSCEEWAQLRKAALLGINQSQGVLD